MSARTLRVCPACRRPARTRPLPPDGFWQEQVLQRIGMYPYRCEDCGCRFYRKVKVGEGIVLSQPSSHPMPIGPSSSPADGHSPAAKRPASAPKVLTNPEAPGDAISHDDFVDLIDHIRRSEERKGLKVSKKDNEEK